MNLLEINKKYITKEAEIKSKEVINECEKSKAYYEEMINACRELENSKQHILDLREIQEKILSSIVKSEPIIDEETLSHVINVNVSFSLLHFDFNDIKSFLDSLCSDNYEIKVLSSGTCYVNFKVSLKERALIEKFYIEKEFEKQYAINKELLLDYIDYISELDTSLDAEKKEIIKSIYELYDTKSETIEFYQVYKIITDKCLYSSHLFSFIDSVRVLIENDININREILSNIYNNVISNKKYSR